jgi:hypothetical protein
MADRAAGVVRSCIVEFELRNGTRQYKYEHEPQYEHERRTLRAIRFKYAAFFRFSRLFVTHPSPTCTLSDL